MAHVSPELRVNVSACPAGVSFLEGKEDILEDWREKFSNTWQVSEASTRVTLPIHRHMKRPLQQINLDCAACCFWAVGTKPRGACWVIYEECEQIKKRKEKQRNIYINQCHADVIAFITSKRSLIL